MNTPEITFKKRVTAVAIFLMGIGVVVGLGYVGTSDYEQALADQQFYCERVAEGVWPKGQGWDCPIQELEPEQQVAHM